MARVEARLRRKGGLTRRADRACGRAAASPSPPDDAAIDAPSRSFSCSPWRAVYVGTIETAFSALMRLSLRLMAERGGRDDRLGFYLDDPIQLFVPARLMLGLIFSLATVVHRRADRPHRAFSRSGMLLLFVAVFILSVRARAADADRAAQSRSGCSSCCCRRSTYAARFLHPLTGTLVRLLVEARDAIGRRRSRWPASDGGARARPRTPTSRRARSRG